MTCEDPTCGPDFECEVCIQKWLEKNGLWEKAKLKPIWSGMAGILENRSERSNGNGENSGGGGSVITKSSAVYRKVTEKQVWFINSLLSQLGETMENVSDLEISEGIELIGVLKERLEREKPKDDFGRWTKTDNGWGIAYRGGNVGDTVIVRKANGDEQTHILGTMVSEGIFEVGKKPVTENALNVQEGKVYLSDSGETVRIKESASGNLYGLVYTNDEWEYTPGIIKRLVKEITLEEAKAFGLQTGWCCVCGRKLKNPESIEKGIGPICESKF